ncbi:MAG: monofunctional biosynthetic peptidoglycan transglycosylase [Paracoccus sp. (in: a-proteobacteria)]|uniref:monofunctional biosynthetic peptidoglycan transglycosylase n=1 Tax=Paracoccus sp. TaxID=267 RepID=UPI0026E0876B|nr:monofunctional biosynthetic peptidoglycan transglycosylase [Paracoccus sp. (in: a-proteobacteria)]MDO5633179.1 monofunctional biosynthetic peptidoglycan transglycosylase [Paracoccus sp. (in: a-proteobacteria)]
MFRKTAARTDHPTPATRRRALLRRGLGWLRWLVLRALVVMLVLVGLFALVNPPTTITIAREATEPRQWTRLADISPVLARSVVAAEDANFCHHWGFDMVEIRRVIDSGGRRGASTITQQTAKNLYLWQSRSWTRKALETLLTPMIEALWSKRRILEVYLNIAEFGDGVFGIHAAAAHYFGTTPDRLTATQSARLAAVLPAPKLRNPRQSRRSAAIADGAATILRDGRAACFTLPARD